MEALNRKIDNVRAGFERYGYFVASDPIPGMEGEYHASLLEGLRKIESYLEHLQKTANCRGTSKRALALLHDAMPSPCWGVIVKNF